MKRIFTLLIFLLTVSALKGVAQWNNSAWGSPLNGNTGNLDVYDSRGYVTIYSSLKSIDDGNFIAIKGTGSNTFIEDVDISAMMAQVPLAKRLKAKAGEPFTIDVHTSAYAGYNFANPNYTGDVYWTVDTSGVGNNGGNLKRPNGMGQNDEPEKYSNFFSWEQKSPLNYSQAGDVNYEAYKKEFVFTKGSTEGYIVFRLTENQHNTYGSTGIVSTTLIFIPFVVEGPTEREIPILGVITKPKIPHMVIHRPPGDKSTAFITTGQKTCRNFEESFQYEKALSGFASIKWGVKATLGILVAQDLEAYVQVTGSVEGGDMKITSSSTETCVETESTISMTSVDEGSEGGDLFIGYGFDAEYGFSNNLYIDTDFSIKYNKGIYLVQLNPVREFSWSESGIRKDLDSNKVIAANLNVVPALRTIAQNQVDAWEKVLALNDENKLAAKGSSTIAPDRVIEGGESFTDYSETVDFTVTKGIETSSYFSGGIAANFLAEYGGTGIAGGVNFTTTNTFSDRTETTASNTTTIGYQLRDGDIGDNIPIRIYRDPMFGTPVFDLLPGAKTSCPFEGGVQRDQPRIQIVGTPGKHKSISDVTLGNPAQLTVQLWNDSNDSRKYFLGVKNETLPSNLLIQANGATNITSTPTEIEIPAGSFQNFTIDISRPFKISPVSLSGIELEWYAGCEDAIRDSLVLDVNWAVPPQPSLADLQFPNPDRRILTCQDVPPISLNATCFSGVTPNWFKIVEGGIAFDTGNTVVVTDAIANDKYYVSCEYPYYITPRSLFGTVNTSLIPTEQNYTLSNSLFGLYVATETLASSGNNLNFLAIPTHFRAGKSVTLEPGFKTNGAAGVFSAEIGGCP